MSVYLGYDTVTKQYLKCLTGGNTNSRGGSSVDTNGFTMSGDINMDGNEIVGLDDLSNDSSAVNKKYVDDEIAKVGGGLDQATADNRYLKKTDATTTCETQRSASNTYLSKTDATSTFAPIDASYRKAESDAKYATSGATSGGLSASGFTMTGDIDIGDNKILKLADPITSKFATNKNDVDNNFLGGLILGDIAMSGQSITNLNPTPQNNNDAVTSYVDNSISLAGGLSITEITMQEDINMDGHNVIGLADPTNDDMAASKGFVESNFLDLAGGTMVGNIDMGGYEITNLLRTRTTDLSAVTKKWVTDEFPTKQEVLGGFTLTGSLNLSGNEIYGLPDVPTTDNSATSKKHVDSKITTGGGASTTGFTMQGDINMGGYEVIGVTSFPSFNNSLTNKKYVDYMITFGLTGVSGGISQEQADGRYVRKTKITLGEWVNIYEDVDKTTYCWSYNVRGDILSDKSNIGIKTISFMTKTPATELAKLTVNFRLGYFRTSMQY